MAWQLIRYLGLKLIGCWLFAILSLLIFFCIKLPAAANDWETKVSADKLASYNVFWLHHQENDRTLFIIILVILVFFLKCVGYTFETWTGDHSLLLLRVAVCLRKSFDTAVGFFKKKKKKKKSFNGKMFNFLKRKILEQQEKKLKSSSSW